MGHRARAEKYNTENLGTLVDSTDAPLVLAFSDPIPMRKRGWNALGLDIDALVGSRVFIYARGSDDATFKDATDALLDTSFVNTVRFAQIIVPAMTREIKIGFLPTATPNRTLVRASVGRAF